MIFFGVFLIIVSYYEVIVSYEHKKFLCAQLYSSEFIAQKKFVIFVLGRSFSYIQKKKQTVFFELHCSFEFLKVSLNCIIVLSLSLSFSLLLLGHSRSAHSFGPGDYINSEQPRRTHMRHNSYEVTGINQNNCGGTNNLLAQQCGGGGCGAGNNNSSSFNRTNSLSSRTNDCSSYSSSSFSVSSLSCSDYSASITDYDVEGGGGGNGSKRSSLDRRSLASASENSDCGGAINATAAAAYIVQQQNEEWKFKRLPQITSILPK